MRSGFELPGIEGIFMKSGPLRKGIMGIALVLVVVPIQHLWVVLESNTMAVCFDDPCRVIKKIVGIHDADLDTFDFADTRTTTSGTIPAVRMVRADKTDASKIIKHASDLIIASFSRIEVVEAGELIQWRYGAAEIRRNAGMRIANQEREVKIRKTFSRDDCGIIRFRRSIEWVRSFLAVPIREGTIGASSAMSLCADPTLLTLKRWCNCSRLPFWRHEVVDDVLDEQTLSLFLGKSSAIPNSQPVRSAST